jgi:hypothetical protein
LVIKKDLKWWYDFLPVVNGVSMMAVEEFIYLLHVLRETTIISNSKQLICKFYSVIKGGKIACTN